MHHLLTPYSEKIESWAWWEDAFNDQELNWLQQKAKEANNPGMVRAGLNLDYRRSNVSWLNKDSECSWVFERLANVVSSLNASYFRFNLTGFGEALQLSNYHASNQGTYKPHADLNFEGISRKLSLVLQLSDPTDYEGGNLQLFLGDEPVNVPKNRGSIVVFPSWTLHQVTPVTKGTRQSLVSWVTGPPFK